MCSTELLFMGLGKLNGIINITFGSSAGEDRGSGEPATPRNHVNAEVPPPEGFPFSNMLDLIHASDI